MKKQILTRLSKLISMVEDETAFFDEQKEAMQERFDNMSERSQESERGEKLQEEITQIEEVYDALQALLDACNNIENDK